MDKQSLTVKRASTRVAITIATTLTVVFSAALDGEGRSVPPTAYFADDDAGCQRCQSGPCSSENAHITNAVSGGDEWVSNDIASGGGFGHWGPHACYWGKACDSHKECADPPGGGGGELPCEPDCGVELLVAAVEAGDAAKVARVLADARSGFVMNPKRAAIQKLNCFGHVEVHVSLAAEFAAAVQRQPGLADE